MIDAICEATQLIVICICEFIAIFDARKIRSRLRLLYGLFLLSFFMGDLWWFLDYLFYDWDLTYSLIPYINWKVALLFLILMMQQYHGGKIFKKPASGFMWTIPVFCGALCAFYMQFGAYLDNILTAVLMSIIIWMAVQRLIEIRQGATEKTGDEWLCRVILLFCTFEYGMWTASCIDYPVYYFYNVFNFALTACFILFIPAVRKAVRG